LPNVCLLTTVHSASDTRIFHKEAQTLAAAGYRVTLVAPGDADGRARRTREAGVDVVYLPLPKGRLSRMLAGSLRALTAALSLGAQAYHIHDPELLPAGLALRLLGRRVLYDVHEDYPEQILSKHYLSWFLRRPIARAFSALEKAVAAHLDGIVCATDTIAGKFSRGRVVTVRNYPTLEVPSPKPQASRRDGVFRLAHVSATLSEERGITNLVRAMEILGDGFELVLAGRFASVAYEKRVRELAGFRRVSFLGTVPHSGIRDLYAGCDCGIVCLLPLKRYQESLPVKLFEYMQAGLAVVASDFPGFREIVESSRCGVCVDPSRPVAIASGVSRLAADTGLARQMGDRGRVAVLARYNWEKEGERLVSFYRQLLSRMPAAGRARTGADSHGLEPADA
jgi:glycosyltransferase involved in cell wall biosynthesis